MMRALLLSVLIGVVAAQITPDPDEMGSIFGDLMSTTSTTTSRSWEKNTGTSPATTTTKHVDVDGDDCKCVPYFYCNADDIAVDIHNKSVSGETIIDMRFRECGESTEKCCKIPKLKKEEEVDTTPAPVPTKRGCGYRNPNGLEFIFKGITGLESNFGEFPWVVAILDSLNSSYIGVGVLLHPKVVLTGAHIVYTYQPRKIKIRAGEWDTQTVKERLKHQERVVQEIYVHSEFKLKYFKNDYALLLLQDPVELAPHINVICMPEQNEDFSKYKGCVANGWGKANFGVRGQYAVILKRVDVDMVPNPTCNQQLKKTVLGSKFNLHDSLICAGGEEGQDTCEGDGGAPLACPIGNDRYKLTGLVSWGIGCGKKDVPAVYAAVSRIRNWVDDQITAWGLGNSAYKV